MSAHQANPQQTQAITSTEGALMVLAGPGTGKTELLAARVAYILESTQLDPYNILCLTFTESGVVALRNRLLKKVGTAAYYVKIHTFHSFCNEIIKNNPERFFKTRELEHLDEVEQIEILREALDALPATSPLRSLGDPYHYKKSCADKIKKLKQEAVTPQALDALLDENKKAITPIWDELENFVGINGHQLKQEHVDAIRPLLKETPFEALDESFPIDLEKKERTAFKNALKKAVEDFEKHWPKQKALVEVYAAYEKELLRRGRYDYEDMILFVLKELQQDANFLAKYQELFQYIMVDEYQDTNGAQNELVRLLGSFFDNPNICVVGDDKQTIYRFQGASMENILEFESLYKKNVQTVSLKANYRSQQNILDAAQAVIDNNQFSLARRFPHLAQPLEAQRSELALQPLQVAVLQSPGTELYYIAKKIQMALEQGVPAQEIAVLFRTNKDARVLADILLRMEIPFHLEAGEDSLRDPLLQQFLRLLQCVHSPQDDLLLFTVLSSSFMEVDKVDLFKVVNERAREKGSLFERILEHPTLKEKASQLLHWQAESLNMNLAQFFDRILKEAGYLKMLLQLPDQLEHLNRLNTLFAFLKRMNQANHKLTLRDFLAHIQLMEENELVLATHELQTKKNAVRLMTAHKAKGLEFDMVFIPQCTHGMWPSPPKGESLPLPSNVLKNSPNHDEEEDERRLFYVAMTRARQTLILTRAASNEKGKSQTPSIFLEEIPKALLEEQNTQAIEDEALQQLQILFLTPQPEQHKEEQRALLQAKVQKLEVNTTLLNNYLRCTRLFYYQNLLRLEAAPDSTAQFGTLIHTALHELGKSLEAGKLLSKEALLAQFEKSLETGPFLSPKDKKDLGEMGVDLLTQYYESEVPKWNKKNLLEYSFSGQGVHLDGIPLTGRLDKIEILDEEKKTVNVVDYKTGNPDNAASKIAWDKDYGRQLAFYQLLCDLAPQFPYTMVSGEIDFVQKSKSKKEFVKKRIPVPQQVVEDLKDQIRSIVDEIQNLRFLEPAFQHYCEKCAYCKLLSGPL